MVARYQRGGREVHLWHDRQRLLLPNTLAPMKFADTRGRMTGPLFACGQAIALSDTECAVASEYDCLLAVQWGG